MRMAQSIGELTKEKFHNFVEYCVNEIGVTEKEAETLQDADKQSATILLTAIKQNISPHIDGIRARDKFVLHQTFQMRPTMTEAQVEKVCLYMELFHELSTQVKL